jgi:hypothetical protein
VVEKRGEGLPRPNQRGKREEKIEGEKREDMRGEVSPLRVCTPEKRERKRERVGTKERGCMQGTCLPLGQKCCKKNHATSNGVRRVVV